LRFISLDQFCNPPELTSVALSRL